MAGALVQRVTFAGGEAGPALRARADLDRYQISVERLENYVVMIEGGATRCPGTRMVLELKNQTQKGRLLPFRVSSSDYYMLVINGGVSRFVRNGGFVANPDTTPHELAVPWTEAELELLRSTTQSNVMFVVVGTRAPQEITRFDHTAWTCVEMPIANGPVGDMNVDPGVTLRATAVTGATNLTGVGAPMSADWVGRVIQLNEPSLQYVAEWFPNEAGLAVGNQRRWNGNVYEVASGADAGVNPPTHLEGTVLAGQGKIAWTYLHSGFGLVRVTAFTDPHVAAGTVLSRLPNSVVDFVTSRWHPPGWSSVLGFPEVIAFNSPMLFFMRGDECWFTSKFDIHDLAEGIDEESAFRIRLRAPDGALVEARWAAACGDWVVGTSDIEWIMRKSGTAAGGLNAGNIDPVPDDNKGSIAQVPAVIDGGVMFYGPGGTSLHFCTIDPQRTGSRRIDVEDLSTTVSHIFKPGGRKMAWQRKPHRVLWMVMDDGTLASFTFMPRQAMYAFARHPRLNAVIEDIAAIPAIEGGTEEVYMIVRRTIAGATKRYVEQLMPFFEPTEEDADGNPTAEGAWFLDCALRYQGAPVSLISNLVHLEGQEVGVFADGAMQKRKTVAGGIIQLDRAASDVLVGLPIVARIMDLPRDLTVADAPTTDREKTVSRAVVDLLNAAGGVLYSNRGAAELGEEDLGEALFETGGKAKGAPLPLFSGKMKLPIEGEIGDEAQIELVNDDALPCTVLGLSPVIEIEEDA